MQVIESIGTMQDRARELRRAGEVLGFVPTMGYLHEGHLSLLDTARPKCDRLIMSVFVNPTQFGENEDFDEYPRDPERDKQLALEHGVDILFHPAAEAMYPENFRTYVGVEQLSEKLCGRSRPTHFRGVTTIVAKLFNITKPDFAVFGQKDAQQAVIIRQMVQDMNFPVDIIVAPIVREEDGLAMSSRNTYLTQSERKQALSLYRGLQHAKKIVESGQVNSNIIGDAIRSFFNEQPDLQEDYISVVDLENLDPLETIDRTALIAVAAYVGTTRLIDNIIITKDGTHSLKIEDSSRSHHRR